MLFDEKYFQAIRPYVPEEARRLLDEQVPAIQKEISSEIDHFAKRLADDVTAEVTAFSKEQADEMNTILAKLAEVSANLAKAQPDPKELATQAATLQASVKAFEDRTKKAGETFRKLALTAARSAGLPIPL
jgi:hypothetical protein